jgi:hypothetical protein
MTRSKEERLAIANVIIRQLGGRLTAMLGAYNIDATEMGLSFRFRTRASNGSNCCVVDLEPSDIYTVKFVSIRGTSVKDIGTFTDIYAENLLPLFERETGLALRIPHIVRV